MFAFVSMCTAHAVFAITFIYPMIGETVSVCFQMSALDATISRYNIETIAVTMR